LARLWKRARLLAAAALLAGTLAGALPLHASAETAPVPATSAADAAAAGPERVFPLLAAPRYGDGLGASRGHEGQDLFAPAGTPEVAVSDAVVLEAAAGYNGGRGNYVSIYDPAANRTYNYFHMIAAPLVAPGQHVTRGEELGQLGCSGSCWGDHLHFELRAGRDPYGPVLDPAPFLHSLPPAGRVGLAQAQVVRMAAESR
jgi:murein DD-endopeptidase MepM/ murein hydrolase activator NlpD